MRAALYARISQDDEGLKRGVDRQLEDARTLAAARGWKVVGEWADNDVSAYSGAHRAGYAEMMAEAEAGAFDRIVVYQTSRLWRSRRERANAMELLAQRRVSVVAVDGHDLDLASASGRMVADIMGAFDTAESAIKGERVARAALQRAQDGRAASQVLYGWKRERIISEDGKVVSFRDVEHPEHAAVVREIVERLLAGHSLRAIADDLERRCVPVPSGRDGVQWRSGTVRKLALRPANVAKRVHHGVERDEHGKRKPRHSHPCDDRCVVGGAAWPALVTEQQHRQVVGLLTDRTRRLNPDTSTRQHLLTYGIGRCGVCGGALRVRSERYHRKRTGEDRVRSLYTCDAGGCTTRAVEPVDDLVRAVVVERLSRPDAADLLRAPMRASDGRAQAQEHAEKLRRRLDDAAADYADGLLDRQQLQAITTRLRPKLDEAVREAGRGPRAPSREPLREALDAGDVGRLWAELDVHRRRALLTALGMAVVINPTRPGPGFEPRDVGIEWWTA
jgi:site-specific DNA recombinase